MATRRAIPSPIYTYQSSKNTSLCWHFFVSENHTPILNVSNLREPDQPAKTVNFGVATHSQVQTEQLD